MFTNTLFKIILIIAVVYNYFALGSFGQKLKNVYEFELQMLEHNIGVAKTFKFLLSQPLVIADPDLAILQEHKELVLKRSVQHDLSKFSHTPEFVARYYPRGSSQQLSVNVFKYFGWDIRANPKGLSALQIAEAKAAFIAINSIDDLLLDELISEYAKEKNLDAQTAALIRTALARLETIADLINRKMLENITRFRRIRDSAPGTAEVFEFGRAIDLHNQDPYFWHNHLNGQKLAVNFFKSRSLYWIIAGIESSEIINAYIKHTKNSPFLSATDRIEQLQTIQEFSVDRSRFQQTYKRSFFKKANSYYSNQCKMFYR